MEEKELAVAEERLAEAEPSDSVEKEAKTPLAEAEKEGIHADASAGEEDDYEALAASDLAEIKRLVPALAGLSHLGEMPDAGRFGELRELGLSVSEALGALGRLGRGENRAHLRSSVPRRVGSDAPRMSYGELEEARRLFPEMNEREIARLYRRVNA